MATLETSTNPRQISEKTEFRQDFSFGWQRARLLGAFFNGTFLLALGVSIFLQSIERFISLKEVSEVKLVLIMGCVGLGLNIITAVFLHGQCFQQSIRLPFLFPFPQGLGLTYQYPP